MVDDAPNSPLAFRPRSFTPDTLAERWSCSPQHIRDLIHRGELAAFRVGRLMRISVDTVIEFERPADQAQSRAVGQAGAPLLDGRAKGYPKVVDVPSRFKGTER